MSFYDEPVEVIDYKKCQIKIFYDEVPQRPDEWGREDLFLVAFHRDCEIEREGYDQELCRSIANPAQFPDYVEEAQEIEKEYFVFGLEAYIHSGVVLALSYEGNFCDRRWDVSQLGLVFVSKKLVPRYNHYISANERGKAKKIARSLVNEWNDYLSGNIYGFQAVDPVRDVDLDSCWGFYGDYDSSGIIDEAKSAIDYYAKEYIATHYEI